MDRGAASEALDSFVGGVSFSANQLAFVKLIIDQLTQRGAVATGLLYEAPFTDYAPHGPDELFTNAQVTNLIDVLRHVAATAAVAS